MTIAALYEFDKHGGFTAVDLQSGVSAYAYPSSTHAKHARSTPNVVAREMIKGALCFPHVDERDNEREDRLRAAQGYPPRPVRT